MLSQTAKESECPDCMFGCFGDETKDVFENISWQCEIRRHRIIDEPRDDFLKTTLVRVIMESLNVGAKMGMTVTGFILPHGFDGEIDQTKILDSLCRIDPKFRGVTRYERSPVDIGGDLFMTIALRDDVSAADLKPKDVLTVKIVITI